MENSPYELLIDLLSDVLSDTLKEIGSEKK